MGAGYWQEPSLDKRTPWDVGVFAISVSRLGTK
jgi:hypothetical protein